MILYTPLHLAANKGHLIVVEYLVDHGADILSENINGEIPLHLASRRGHLKVVEFLKRIIIQNQNLQVSTIP